MIGHLLFRIVFGDEMGPQDPRHLDAAVEITRQEMREPINWASVVRAGSKPRRDGVADLEWVDG